MKKQAFTLIEVMVVLSILAIIAILAYNFFGSSMKDAKTKQAATKVFNDMRIISDASQLYYDKMGVKPAASADLVSSGTIKSYPTEDSAYHATSNPTYQHYQLNRWDLGGSVTLDDSVWWMVTDELCLAVEEKYNGASAIPAASAAPAQNKSIQCWYELGGEPGADMWIIMPTFLN